MGPIGVSKQGLWGALWGALPGLLWSHPERSSGASLEFFLDLLWGFFGDMQGMGFSGLLRHLCSFPGHEQGRGVPGKAGRWEKQYVRGTSCAEPSAASLRAADRSLIRCTHDRPSTDSKDANDLQSTGLLSIGVKRSFL